MSGYLCAPKCDVNTYDCPADLPYGASAKAQCMLQDVAGGAYCGLLCQVDSQCPSGARCLQNKQMEVGVCIFSVSFNEWAQGGAVKKFAIGWPSQPAGQAPASFQIAKTYGSLQALKKKYNIEDGDADMVTLKEFLSSLGPPPSSGTGFGVAAASPVPQVTAAPQSSAGTWDFAGSKFQHDITYFENNLMAGLPGIQREIHDTVWNIEHINDRGTACELLRGTILLALLYLGLGVLIKSQMMGSRGLDMIPHIGFWAEYPKLVADGIAYSQILLSGIIGKPIGVGGSRGARGGTGYFEEL